MTVQGLGVGVLTTLMRADRRRDLDSSWLLFGPEDEQAETLEVEELQHRPWRFAAE